MDQTTYVSRKVMDKYQDKMTIRLDRLWKRIVKLEATVKVLHLDKHCKDDSCPVCHALWLEQYDSVR